LALVFGKGPDDKYLQLFGPYGLCQHYSTLPLQVERSHTQFVKKGALLCSNKTLFTKTVSWLDLVTEP
jgi:hypothetical protein